MAVRSDTADKRSSLLISPLYWIADVALVGETALEEVARSAIGAGLRLLQYRDKRPSKRDRYELARTLAALCHGAGATFVVNDDIDLAFAVDASGVHLGQDDFPVGMARQVLGESKLIGCSAHTVDLARAAAAEGADYLGAGPVFLSATKMARPALGCAVLGEICAAVRVPVYGIGGITVERCRQVMAAGASGVAVASALSPGKIQAETRRFLEALRSRDV